MWELLDPSTSIKCVKCTVLNPWMELNVQQSANDNARGGGDFKFFLNTPYLGHLGLHPGGFERRHGLLCCSWAVEIHKAIAWRKKRRGGAEQKEKRQALVKKK